MSSTIAGVVRVARAFTPEVIVVSDGSVDGTAGAAREAGAEVVDLAVNVGKGGALHAGLRAARADVVQALAALATPPALPATMPAPAPVGEDDDDMREIFLTTGAHINTLHARTNGTTPAGFSQS